MKEREALIKQLKDYQIEFIMSFDSSHHIEQLINCLEEEEACDEDS